MRRTDDGRERGLADESAGRGSLRSGLRSSFDRKPIGAASRAGVWLVALTVLSGTVLAGCSSSSSGASGGSTSTARSNQSLISQIKSRGELRLGVATAQPNSFKDPQTGVWKGIYVELMKDWAQVLGVKFVPVPTTFGNMIAGLQAHQFDIGSNLNQRPQRALAVTFTDPVLSDIAGAAFYSARAHLSRWADLDQPQNTICVVLGSAEDGALTAAKPKAQIIRLEDQNSCRVALQSGRATADFDDWLALGPFAKATSGLAIVFPPTPLVNEGIAYAIAPEYSYDDVQAINIEINAYRVSGKLQAVEAQVGSVDPVPYAVGTVPQYVRADEALQYPSNS